MVTECRHCTVYYITSTECLALLSINFGCDLSVQKHYKCNPAVLTEQTVLQLHKETIYRMFIQDVQKIMVGQWHKNMTKNRELYIYQNTIQSILVYSAEAWKIPLPGK
jgi:hypothetical protein